MEDKEKNQTIVKDESPEMDLLYKRKFVKEEIAHLQNMTVVEQMNWLIGKLKREFHFYLPKTEQINALKTLYGRDVPESFSNGLLGNLAFVLRDKIIEHDAENGFDDNIDYMYQRSETAKNLVTTKGSEEYETDKNLWLSEGRAIDWIAIALCGFFDIDALPVVFNRETVKYFYKEM